MSSLSLFPIHLTKRTNYCMPVHTFPLSLSLSLCEYISDANSQIPSPILSFDLILGALSPHVRSNK
jgi:hypothetical protein